MKIEAEVVDNPKFKQLKRAVGDGAMEYLVKLWGYCESKRMEFLDRSDPEFVERLCEWEGPPGELYLALAATCGGKVGFIVEEEDGLRVHDWEEVNQNMVETWRKNRAALEAVRQGGADLEDDDEEDDAKAASPGRGVHRRQPDAATPDGAPTLDDVLDFCEYSGLPELTGQRVHEWHTIKGKWFSKSGRLVDWRFLCRKWAAEDCGQAPFHRGRQG